MTCSSCGAHVEPGRRFCLECGAPVAATLQMAAVLAIDRPEVAEVIEGSRRIVTDLGARAWLDRLDKILGLRRSGARAARPGAVALSMPAAERDPR